MRQNEGEMISDQLLAFYKPLESSERFHQGMGWVPSDEKIPATLQRGSHATNAVRLIWAESSETDQDCLTVLSY